MFEIGRRYAKKFPEMLHGDISIADFNFTSSSYSRSSQSAMAFGMGYLVGKGHVTELKLQPLPIATYPRGKDKLHNLVGSCPRFQKNILRNRTTFAESRKFLKSERFQKIVRNVRRKLGLIGVKELNEQLVVSMFSLCGWSVEALGHSLQTGWCSVFTTEDQKIYDLYTDLANYYLIGPGNQLNKDMTCHLLRDIFTSLDRTAKEDKRHIKRKVTVRIGHGHTVIFPLLKLGLFIDKFPLKADTDYDKLKSRQYRAGKIAPMSSNFAFVLYRCGNGKYDKYKIQFYHNERLVKLPACQSKVDCTLKELLNHYRGIQNEKCDIDQLCQVA